MRKEKSGDQVAGSEQSVKSKRAERVVEGWFVGSGEDGTSHVRVYLLGLH